MKRLQAKASQSNQRLDQVTANWLKITRSQAAKAIRGSQILLNGLKVKPGELVETGDKISYDEPIAAAKPLKLSIIYEDADILVVDKPAGLIVHPTGNSADQVSLVDFAKAHSLDPDLTRPGIIHRLDKDTSGLLIVAKTAAAKTFMQRQFAGRQVEKEYIALVSGILPKAEAQIQLPIGPGAGIRRQIDPSGRIAMTKYQRTKQFNHAALVKAWPKTGRTHQIRVHFAAIGHPVVGDKLYGQADLKLGRQFLHAHKLAFTAPNGQWLSLICPLPKSLRDYLDQLD